MLSPMEWTDSSSETDLPLLRSEADFYLLSEMVADIDERIAQRKASVPCRYGRIFT